MVFDDSAKVSFLVMCQVLSLFSRDLSLACHNFFTKMAQVKIS